MRPCIYNTYMNNIKTLYATKNKCQNIYKKIKKQDMNFSF